MSNSKPGLDVFRRRSGRIARTERVRPPSAIRTWDTPSNYPNPTARSRSCPPNGQHQTAVWPSSLDLRWSDCALRTGWGGVALQTRAVLRCPADAGSTAARANRVDFRSARAMISRHGALRFRGRDTSNTFRRVRGLPHLIRLSPLVNARRKSSNATTDTGSASAAHGARFRWTALGPNGHTCSTVRWTSCNREVSPPLSG